MKGGFSSLVTKPSPISDDTHQEPTPAFYCLGQMNTVSIKCAVLYKTS